MGELVKVYVEDQIGHLIMNRPEKINALSRELVEEMILSIEQLANDQEVKAIVLSGEGRSFCAGGDIDSMKKLSSPNEVLQWIDFVSSLTQKIMNLDKYVIAAVHGYAAGAGFSLALAADFIVADKDSKFVLSFSNIGLIPDLGLIKLLTERISPQIAKEWISSAKIISANEAYQHGVINRVTNEDVLKESVNFAQFILNGPPISNKFVKYLM